MRRRLILIVVAIILVLLITYSWLTQSTTGHVIVERLIGESPEAKLVDYMMAIQRSDRNEAIACWRAKSLEGYETRRHQVTNELLALGPEMHYHILETQWWAALCCEPGIVRDPLAANVARMRVEVTGREGQPRQYIFEIRARAILGNEMHDKYPVRIWALADAYSADSGKLSPDWPPPPCTSCPE